MARRGWDSLSDSYRSRLQKGGVSKSDYESGADITSGRGHKFTPEHPERAEKHKDKYKDYLERKQLRQDVARKAERMFGDTLKWDRQRFTRNLNRSKNYENMRKFLDYTPYQVDVIKWGTTRHGAWFSDREWSFLWYH
jgi:hypothetical protein